MQCKYLPLKGRMQVEPHPVGQHILPPLHVFVLHTVHIPTLPGATIGQRGFTAAEETSIRSECEKCFVFF